jgi:hypothetical protein
MNKKNKGIARFMLALMLGSGISGANSADQAYSISPKIMADALHLVIESGRTAYTQTVISRLTREEKVIKVSEHFIDDKSLALPAQFFRHSAEIVDDNVKKHDDLDFSYALRSLWPIRKKNGPQSAAEKAGLKYVVDTQGDTFYAEEVLDGKKYFTAVYADVAVSPVCVSCHNTHKRSPRRDFKPDDIMGGIVIRIGLTN